MPTETRDANSYFDVVVIGAGFFGCEIALELKKNGVPSVALIDREGGIVRRASAVNQARIHNGYHYPRAIVTAERSRRNYDRFTEDYGYATHDMRSIYAVARGSKVSASQFHTFCRRIGAPCREAPRSIARLFNDALVDAVFETQELTFNAARVAAHIEGRLNAADILVQLNSPAKLAEIGDRHVILSTPGGSVTARYVINATYANLDRIGIPLRSKIKRELAELVLIQAPPELEGIGITVVDGPYFSVMPFPSGHCHSLSHVRYTPRLSRIAPPDDFVHMKSHAIAMMRDAARYLPCIMRARVQRSLYEWKALLQESEESDSRPILIETSAESRRIVSILGGKIDNIYDALEFVRSRSWSN